MAVLGSLRTGQRSFALSVEVVSNTQSDVCTAVLRNTTSPHDNPLEQGQVRTYRSRGSPNFL